MIDLASKPTRMHGRGNFACSKCHVNLVTKEGGLCRRCTVGEREKKLKAEGKPRPWSHKKTLRKPKGNSAYCPNSPTGAHFQKIITNEDGSETGHCIYCHGEFQYPPEGENAKKMRSLKSNSKGGIKADRLRGGRRGKPRQLEATI
jgi:hypothetical protein